MLPLVCATPPTPHVMHRCGIHDLSWYWYTFLASAWSYTEGLVPLYSFLLLSVPAIWIMPGLSNDRKYSNGTILLREYYHTLTAMTHLADSPMRTERRAFMPYCVDSCFFAVLLTIDFFETGCVVGTPWGCGIGVWYRDCMRVWYSYCINGSFFVVVFSVKMDPKDRATECYCLLAQSNQMHASLARNIYYKLEEISQPCIKEFDQCSVISTYHCQVPDIHFICRLDIILVLSVTVGMFFPINKFRRKCLCARGVHVIPF